MPSVLIIIVTYNGSNHIRQCLTSYDVGNPDVSCMIVDNGSTDDTVKIIKEEFPEVILVESGKNLGFGAANNIGLRKALDDGYGYVYLLNQDAWVFPDTFSKLKKAFGYGPYGILSPIQYDRGGKKMDRQFARRCRRFIRRQEGEKVAEVPFVMAAHWMICRG